MRVYQNKKNQQKKSYHSDRFYITPQVPRQSIYNDSIFSADYLSLLQKVDIIEAFIEIDHLVIIVKDIDNIKTINHLKQIRAYDFMMELTAVDYLEKKDGFEIVYELLSTSKRKRIRVKCFLNQNNAIESVTSIFRMANWSEREMYDMYGVKVNNHPLLKRILMPDDWVGHPLLKSYPLIGDETAQWYEVDTIFGKEARDIIGPEDRDSATIDRYDTQRFSRLGHEVPKGAIISEGNEPDTPISYQEKGGIKIANKAIITPFDEIETINLEERR
jgi:NADH-quinone oxidoreductase subunit C